MSAKPMPAKPISSKLTASLRRIPGIPLERLSPRIAKRLQMGLHARTTRYGLRRDLATPLDMPQAKIPLAVRPLRREDLAIVLPRDGVADAEKPEIADRYAFLDKVGMGAFVAIDLRTDTPCYIQWLLGPDKNEIIRTLGCFPQLAPDEALLEGAYTPPAHRGLGIMSVAMAMIAERAADIGARYVLTFVADDNVPSLKGCQRAGFSPHMLHHFAQWGYGLRLRNDFSMLPADDARRTLRL